MIREVERPNIKDMFSWGKFSQAEVPSLARVRLVGSGKGAIALVLGYLKNKNLLADKTDEILVPQWLGYWVYNQMQPWVFPVKKYSEKTKIIFVYHQYGFPQAMDEILAFAQEKKLIVVEDCAHAIGSQYQGKTLGAMGDFSIYSFSKWFFCYALGAVKSRHDDFNAYVNKSLADASTALSWFKDLVKLIYEHSTFSKGKSYKNIANHLLNMSYAIYGQAIKPGHMAEALFREKMGKEIQIRQKRYNYFLKETAGLGLCDHLEREGITPYVIPIRPDDNKIDRLVKTLKSRGFVTGRYYFDVNRNLLSPDFKPVVWVPCHGGIPDQKFYDLTELIIKTAKL